MASAVLYLHVDGDRDATQRSSSSQAHLTNGRYAARNDASQDARQ
jgi:hypothetical protein